MAVDNLRNPFPVLVSPGKILPSLFLISLKTWHGVNMAEGLKALPSTYRFTHNQSGKRYESRPL